MPGPGGYGLTEAAVPGYPGYMARSDGCILSVVAAGRGGRYGKFVLTGRTHGKDLHLYVRLSLDGRRVRRPIHQLVLETFVGPRPSLFHVTRHMNGNMKDNRPSNLRWGTHAQNTEDAIRLGEILKGEDHPRAKLTAAQVVDLRTRISLGEVTQRQAATELGVGPTLVNAIVLGRIWKSAGGPLKESRKHHAR